MGGKTLSSDYLTKSTYFTSRKDVYQLDSGKIVDPYYVVEIPDSVICMGITDQGEVLLVKQYRHPIQQMSFELPGGFIDPGEDIQKAAAREIMEETGYAFTSFHALGKTSANPGLISNYTHLYIALGGKKSAAQSLDENEEIEIIHASIPEIKHMMNRGEIIQSLHEVCIHRGLAFLENQ